MKQIIKSAIVYKADFGMSATDLNEKLIDHKFQECPPNHMRSVGFVPVSEGDSLSAEFANGFAFRVRIDQKAVPAQAVAAKTASLIAQFTAQELRKPNKEERLRLKDAALYELAEHAFPRSAIITCLYQQTTGYLIVPTTSKKLSDIIITALILAAGSVKTETIHVSSVKHGLTERMRRWSDGDDDAFGVFQPCAEAALQQDKRKISIKMGQLRGAETGIKEALASSFEVMSMGFTHQGETEFRLTSDFRLKGIGFAHTDAEASEESSFYAQASLEVDAVSSVVTDLIEMIGRGKEQVEGETESAVAAAQEGGAE